MIQLVAILCLCINPIGDVLRESVSLIEINNFFDDCGRLVFAQQIFWDWSEAERRYNVRAWRLVKSESQIPQRDWANGGYVAQWMDGDKPRLIHSKNVRETWTQYDVELVEREHLAKEKRRELRGK